MHILPINLPRQIFVCVEYALILLNYLPRRLCILAYVCFQTAITVSSLPSFWEILDGLKK